MTSQLSEETCRQLMPLLGSLARLVARGSQLGESELVLLLLGGDLEDEPAALDELRRWGKMLKAVQARPAPEQRAAAREALLLRGLPEASVLLAIDAVSTRPMPAGTESAPTGRAELAASVTGLDFGILAAGQMGCLDLEVRGGPGQVMVASSHVHVDPLQFGADTTRLVVKVSGTAGALLWSTMRLVTAAEALEVPLIAQWASTGTPVASEPVLPGTSGSLENRGDVASSGDWLVVAPDGSGDYLTLVEAIAAAGEGATIRLRKGIHRLEQGLRLGQAVSLVGEGMESTEIVAEQGEYTLRYEGSGLFGLRALSVRWGGTGPEAIDVVVVHSGEVQIERCRFTGATWTETLYGAGLQMDGQVRGRVAGCCAEANGYGILVLDQAEPMLEENVCRLNRQSGIGYSGASGGVCRANQCSDNESTGIALQRQAHPFLGANICDGNRFFGISYCGDAGGTARQNICERNQSHGIVVVEKAQPSLEGNTCESNKGCGIAYFGTAAGTARSNRCTANEGHGIYMIKEAQPSLEGNTCEFNKECGIAYFDTAAGHAKSNQCTGNEKHGIFVDEEAQPSLEGNTCKSNKDSGIGYSGTAAGVAKTNKCTGNGRHGISVRKQAQPSLEGNACESNKGCGMAYSDTATGLAKSNHCAANEKHGIYVDKQAQPSLEGNVCDRNKADGISMRDTAGGVVRANQCIGNGEDGIYLASTVSPRLYGNQCHNNRGKDVNDERPWGKRMFSPI